MQPSARHPGVTRCFIERIASHGRHAHVLASGLPLPVGAVPLHEFHVSNSGLEQAWTPCDATLLLVQDRALLASRAVAPSSSTFIYVKEVVLGHLRLAVVVCRRGS